MRRNISSLASTIALSLSFIALCPGEAEAETSARKVSYLSPVLIHQDLGGSVVKYARKVSQLKMNGRKVQISGRCDSACTLYLALPPSQVCINPGASFGFHRAYGSNKSMNEWGTKYLIKSYPGWVVNWLHRQGGMDNSVKRVSFKTASRHIARCEARILASR